MKRSLIGISLAVMSFGINAAELTDMTEIEYPGRQLLVYQGHCAQESFTVQKVSKGYRFIGPHGTGMAESAKIAVQEACGEVELDC